MGTAQNGTVSGSGSGNSLTFTVIFPATGAVATDNYGTTNSRSGAFEAVGDVDMFKFTAPATGTYEFYTSNNVLSANNNNLDTYGVLYSSAQTQLTSNDDSAGNLNFKITAH